VEFISGLHDFPPGKLDVSINPTPKETSKAAAAPGATTSGQPVIVPQSISSLYDIPAGTKVTYDELGNAVIEFVGQYYSPQDLQYYAQSMAIPIAPVSADHLVGQNDPDKQQLEATLDIQLLGGTGVGAPLWFWSSNPGGWLYDFALDMYNTKDIPYVISISYGWDERMQCAVDSTTCVELHLDSRKYVETVDVLFMKLGLRGVSILASSGDSGATGRTSLPGLEIDQLAPSYPASSPYVTAVGATQVYRSTAQFALKNPPPACTLPAWNCISNGNQVAVSFSDTQFNSGGGFSNFSVAPWWQVAAVDAYLNNTNIVLPDYKYWNKTGRGYPDVSAIGADILIVFQDQLKTIAGTSASCPIVAGIINLLNDYVFSVTKKPLGFLNPLLYEMYYADPSIYIDITVGDNKCTESGCDAIGFVAAKGWDPVTGLGSIVYSKALAYIKQKLSSGDMINANVTLSSSGVTS